MRAMMSDYNLCCRPQARTNVNNLGERCTAEISASARSPRAVILAICYFVWYWIFNLFDLGFLLCFGIFDLMFAHVVKVGNWKGESNIAYPVPRMGKIIEKVLISVAFSELKVVISLENEAAG
ncbi:uncharacterized protein DS421_11g342620 [Arachis hypogaea]|nr:uncharacterized protein DS421_11g342620 [Arachis hypogaea]